MNRSLRNSLTCAVTVACAALGAPVVASAQGGDGYLFSEPNLTLKFESGYGFQKAGSDIFDFVIQEHTLDRRDFDSPYIGGEVGIRLSERLDLGS